VSVKCDGGRKQMEQKWDNKLSEVADMREELQRQINELRRASDPAPLPHSDVETNTTPIPIRQKSEVQLLYSTVLC